MSVLLHDGTPDGLLCAVAEAAEGAGPLPDVRRADAWHPCLFGPPPRTPAPDPVRAHRLLDELRARGSGRAARRALFAVLSGQEEAGTALAGYVRQVRRLGARADDFLADPSVACVHRLARAVGAEIHRLKGLVRFRRLLDGTLWAPIAPDANVVAPLALHFRGRMPDDPWMLHDLARCLAVRWDLRELAWVAEEALPPHDPPLAPEEASCQALWQTYFRTIAIGERRNPRLQRQVMPVRYWKHLVERPAGRPR